MNTSDTSSQKSAEKDEFAPPPLDKSGKDTLSIEGLQNEVSGLKKENRRIKFVYSLLFLILVDFLLFREMENWAGGIVIGIFQFILILFIGQILGVRIVDSLITRFLDAISSKNKNSD